MFWLQLPFTLPPLLFESFVDGLGNGTLHEVHVADDQRCKDCLQLMMEATVFKIIYGKDQKLRLRISLDCSRVGLTISSQIIVEYLEQWERVPRVWWLFGQHTFHVECKHGPKHLGMFHQQITKPSKSLCPFSNSRRKMQMQIN